MAGATFGRKGVIPGAAAGPARSAFGAARGATADVNAPSEADDPYASQRAAFLAAERARGPEGNDEIHAGAAPRAGSNPVFIREKSMGVAYLLWFLFCQLGVHRFYAGATQSAVIQASLFVVGWMMVASGMLVAFVAVVVGAIWALADAFMIPGLIREANRKARERSVAQTFA